MTENYVFMALDAKRRSTSGTNMETRQLAELKNNFIEKIIQYRPNIKSSMY